MEAQAQPGGLANAGVALAWVPIRLLGARVTLAADGFPVRQAGAFMV